MNKIRYVSVDLEDKQTVARLVVQLQNLEPMAELVSLARESSSSGSIVFKYSSPETEEEKLERLAFEKRKLEEAASQQKVLKAARKSLYLKLKKEFEDE